MSLNFATRLDECFAVAADSSRTWLPVCFNDEVVVEMSPAEEGAGYAVLQFRRTVEVSSEHVADITRPEGIHLLAEVAPFTREARVVRSFAPGDALVSFRLQTGMPTLLLALLRGQSCQAKDSRDTLLFRNVRRCDFPEPGHVTTVSVQMDEDLRLAGGAWIDFISPGQRTGTATCRKMIMVPRIYEWMVPSVGKLMLNYQNSQKPMKWICTAKREVFTEAAGYLVLRMRKCCRGPPLLPISLEEASLLRDDAYMCFLGEYWRPASTNGSFHLCEYMHHVLAFFGRHSDQIYDSLDGRYVAFFQAVVRRDSWPAMRDIMSAFMPRQQAAYRRWYGGSGAPTLQADVAPLYLPGDTGTTTPPSESEEQEESDLWPWQALCCKNTFVHFAMDLMEDDVISAP